MTMSCMGYPQSSPDYLEDSVMKVFCGDVYPVFPCAGHVLYSDCR